MPAEVINLLSSPELPKAIINHPTKKTSHKARARAISPTIETVGDNWLNISSDTEVQKSIPALPKTSTSCVVVASDVPLVATIQNLDWLPALSSDSIVPSPNRAGALENQTSKATHSLDTSNTRKGGSDFVFLSDDFDSTVNFDDSVDIHETTVDCRRLSSSPGNGNSVTKPLRTTGFKRSVSDLEPSTRTGGKRSAGASLSKKAKRVSKALELDPIVFTSSPDPVSEAARRRKDKHKFSWDVDSDESDILEAGPAKTNGKKGRVEDILQPSHHNQSKGLPAIIESSDIELPDIDSMSSKQRSNKLARDSQSVLAQYNAEKAKERKSLEKVKKGKEAKAAKEVEKEQKRLEKEKRAKEKEQGAALAKVNTLRTDKKVSTPEMIVDLPSSLEPKLAEQARTFLTGLQVEHTEWQSTLPIIKWRRKVVAVYNEEMGHYEPVAPHVKKENHIMYVMNAKEFVELATGEEGKDLDSHVLRLKALFEDSEMIFLIQGFNPWMRKNRNIKNRKFTQAVREQGNQDEPPTAAQRRKKKEDEYVDENILEDAMLRLQIIHGALIHHTAVMNETAEWITVFTQHISTIPYRSQRQSLDTAFCMESGQVKAGDGAADTYTKMLQEIVRITAPIAYGIAAEYPTLRQLVEGLEKNGPLALEDCRKSANKDGAFTDRRVGPAISKRVYKVFTGRDPGSLDV